MNKSLKKKLGRGLVPDPSFVLPEVLGDPQKGSLKEVEQFLGTTWGQFRNMSPTEVEAVERELTALRKKYRSQVEIEREKIWAARKGQIDLSMGRVYIELEGRLGQEGVIPGDKVVEHRQSEDGAWVTRWHFLQPATQLVEAARDSLEEYRNTKSLVESRLSVLRAVKWQRAVFGEVPTWKGYWGSLTPKQKARAVGRPPTARKEYRQAIRDLLADDEAGARYEIGDEKANQHIDPSFWEEVVRKAKKIKKGEDVTAAATSAYTSVTGHMRDEGFKKPYTIEKVRDWAEGRSGKRQKNNSSSSSAP